MHVINYDLPSPQYGGIEEYTHRIGKFPSTINITAANKYQVVLVVLATWVSLPRSTMSVTPILLRLWSRLFSKLIKSFLISFSNTFLRDSLPMVRVMLPTSSLRQIPTMVRVRVRTVRLLLRVVMLVADGVRQLLQLRSTLVVVGVRLRLLLLLMRLRLLLDGANHLLLQFNLLRLLVDGVYSLLLQFNLLPLLLDGVKVLVPLFNLLRLLPVGVLLLRILRPMLVVTGDNNQLRAQVKVFKVHLLRVLLNLNQVDGVLRLLPLLNLLRLNQQDGVLRLLLLRNLLSLNHPVAGVHQLLRPQSLKLPAGAHPHLLRLPQTTTTMDGVLLPLLMHGRLSPNTSRQR
jgi:hypothetical protein